MGKKQTQQPRDSQKTTNVLHPICHCWNLLAKAPPVLLQPPNSAKSLVPEIAAYFSWDYDAFLPQTYKPISFSVAED